MSTRDVRPPDAAAPQFPVGPFVPERTYYHPEARADVSLFEALSNYAWHSRHHTAQIVWVRRHRLGLGD